MKQKQKFIIGRKVGMTQIYDEDGNQVPVTVIQAGPCIVVQKKTIETDGYNAVQIGYGEQKEKKMIKPFAGHLRKHNIDKNVKVLQEVVVDDISKYNEGDIITAAVFSANEIVDVSGISTGKGFAGTVKRWNFNVGPKAHGSKNHRIPGSIGSGTGVSRVVKGKKMAGHLGNERVTARNLKVQKVMEEDNVLLIKGAVPGKKDTIVTITA